MATFSKTTFNAANYAAARPTYPRQLYALILKYHESKGSGGARWETAVDLGCGTGQATAELTAFKRVVGVDPSAKMVDTARQYIATLGPSTNQFEFLKSPAEDLPFLADGSVDLVVSAQASHWFDWQKLWPELARVLRKDGTVAIWGYSEFRLTNYSSLTPLINAYSQGNDPATSLGPHWERPGRTIVDNHLIDIPTATDVMPDKFADAENIYFAGDHYPNLPSPRPVILRKSMSWEGFEEYLRSFSSLHTFHERYPDDLNAAEGDIATRFLRNLKKEMKALPVSPVATPARAAEKGEEGGDVMIEWPLALKLVKRT